MQGKLIDVEFLNVIGLAHELWLVDAQCSCSLNCLTDQLRGVMPRSAEVLFMSNELAEDLRICHSKAKLQILQSLTCSQVAGMLSVIYFLLFTNCT